MLELFCRYIIFRFSACDLTLRHHILLLLMYIFDNTTYKHQKSAANALTSRLGVMFLWLLRSRQFPCLLETGQCHPNSERFAVLLCSNYLLIPITLVLSKEFERLVSVRLGWFLQRSGVFPTTQFAFRKDLGPMHCKVHWKKVDTRLGLRRLTSPQP